MSAKPSLLVLDTLDDRREIWSLLHRLSPRDRVRFLGWCCSQVAAPGSTRPTPSLLRMGEVIGMADRCDRADDRLTNEVYGDVLVLASQWGLDLGRAAVVLERRARGRR